MFELDGICPCCGKEIQIIAKTILQRRERETIETYKLIKIKKK